MIRVSKHNLSDITNKGKLIYIDSLFYDYKIDLCTYINKIISGNLPIKKMLSSSQIPSELLNHSWYKQILYKQASSIIRSQIDRANKRRYNSYKRVYFYFKNNNRQIKFTIKKYSELELKDILKSRYFTRPNLNNISINFDERFFDIQIGKYFDNFVRITLPYFHENKKRAIKINIPLKQHVHSNKLNNKGFTLRKNIQIKNVNNKYIVLLIWEKQEPIKRTNGRAIGLDMGYKKLITTSEGEFIGLDMETIYNNISRKKQGSKNFKQLLSHRDNMINYHINNINLSDVSFIIVEALRDTKHKSKFSKGFNNKLQRWSYVKTLSKLKRVCEENGIEMVEVPPAYTSQTCSNCREIHKESRQGETYTCISCGYEVDADYNASVNILHRGVYSPSEQRLH